MFFIYLLCSALRTKREISAGCGLHADKIKSDFCSMCAIRSEVIRAVDKQFYDFLVSEALTYSYHVQKGRRRLFFFGLFFYYLLARDTSVFGLSPRSNKINIPWYKRFIFFFHFLPQFRLTQPVLPLGPTLTSPQKSVETQLMKSFRSPFHFLTF